MIGRRSAQELLPFVMLPPVNLHALATRHYHRVPINTRYKTQQTDRAQTESILHYCIVQ